MREGHTVSEPPEYNDAADHLMLNSSSAVKSFDSSRLEVKDGSAVPAACIVRDFQLAQRQAHLRRPTI